MTEIKRPEVKKKDIIFEDDDIFLEVYCRKCDKKTIVSFEDSHNNICEECGERTEVSVPTEILWCSECKVPIISNVDQTAITHCKICSSEVEYMTTDVRPVFPQERLLLELLLDKPLEFINDSVWASKRSYHVNGKRYSVSNNKLQEIHTSPEKIKKLRADIDYYTPLNQKNNFQLYIDKFIKINKDRHMLIKQTAFDFINKVVKDYNYDKSQILVSFSGGKDSTVLSDLVIKALSSPDIKHIFGDTTLEYPTTKDYLDSYRKNNPRTVISTAKNREQNFLEVCDVIGPPSRVMRWCCHMFKTGPISRKIDHMFKDINILTFYGIRASESESRSKYERIYDSPKIARQKVASPIFDWKDVDIWLHILSDEIEFNYAYQLGFSRVGCWCCPNNNVKAELLAHIYSPDLFDTWKTYLYDFAKKIGKTDYDVYIDDGKWKARQGGYGIDAADDININTETCTKEADAYIYKVNGELTEEFYQMFIPVGEIRKDLGRKALDERIIIKPRTMQPLFSIQPFNDHINEYSVKVRLLDQSLKTDFAKANFMKKVEYQITKFNGCKNCLACEAICKFRAITIRNDRYNIDNKKCTKCGMCMNPKYINKGCLMTKYLFKAEPKE
ncbi:MAG: phosphoadenosine phosphosulfate reductase family protein [Clostridiales bacterium]|nr:phosphoadenosine phosphosulfate reductase family protein [Clostridiales bacterium]